MPPPVTDPVAVEQAPLFDLAADLQQIQGLWEARWAGRLIRREIVGSKEQVSYYGHDGLMERSHIAHISVGRSPDGGLRIFRWTGLTSVSGPAFAPGAQAGEYLYECDGTVLKEYVGATLTRPTATESVEWTLIAKPEPPPPPPAPVSTEYIQ